MFSLALSAKHLKIQWIVFKDYDMRFETQIIDNLTQYFVEPTDFQLRSMAAQCGCVVEFCSSDD